MSITEKEFDKIKKAYLYYDKLIGKPIIYVYITKDNKYNYLKVDYKRSNFMHLCGVTYNHKGKPNANEFYNALESNSLDLQEVKCKSDGTTKQKLLVINDIQYLITCSVSIVDNKLTLLNSEFDKSIKRKHQLLLGLKNTEDFYVPVSLFNIKGKQYKMTPCEVVGVFRDEITGNTIIDKKPTFDMVKASKII